MGEKKENNTFISAMKISQMRVPHIPNMFILPPSQRPNISLNSYTTTLPIIDLSTLNHSSLRSKIVQQVGIACETIGVFQVINHGIPNSIINDAIEIATEFFKLPEEEKMNFVSDNVHNPVRYGTSLNHAKDKVHFWRDFIKHYSHPISTWIHQWPSNPPAYKEKVGNYVVALQELQKQLLQVIFESLDLIPNYLQQDIQEGSQLMAVNIYPACPEPELALGMPPHSDYGTITILAQNQQGLQIKDQNNNWINVPVVEGSLVVQIGDQMEVMSNGKYKSVMHRVTLNKEKNRISIASLHSMGLEKKVGPDPELVDGANLARYTEGSFGEFLDYLHENGFTELERYIDTLKKEI